MNIAVIGATGMVGERIVAEAVARGHQVDAYSRSGNVVPGAESKTVDLANTDELVSIVNGHDVTIIAVSAGRGTSADPVINAHKALIAAKPAGRLLIVGGAGSLMDENGVRLVDTDGFPEAYKNEAKAFCQILEEYRASEGLAWTLLSPHLLSVPVSAPANTMYRLTLLLVLRLVLKILLLLCLMKRKPQNILVFALPLLTKM